MKDHIVRFFDHFNTQIADMARANTAFIAPTEKAKP